MLRAPCFIFDPRIRESISDRALRDASRRVTEHLKKTSVYKTIVDSIYVRRVVYLRLPRDVLAMVGTCARGECSKNVSDIADLNFHSSRSTDNFERISPFPSQHEGSIFRICYR